MTMQATIGERAARVRRIGYRGVSDEVPPNSMAAFRAAFAAGCDWVACDVRPCADGSIVLAREDTVIDCFGRIHRIDEMPSHELTHVDFGTGEGVATLEELVAWAAGRVGVFVAVPPIPDEASCEATCRATGEALSPLRPATKMVCMGDTDGCCRLRSTYPDVPLARAFRAGDSLPEDGDAPDLDAVVLEAALVNLERVATLHRRGLRVIAGPVDDVETMRALADLGVDALLSCRPDRLAAL